MLWLDWLVPNFFLRSFGTVDDLVSEHFLVVLAVVGGGRRLGRVVLAEGSVPSRLVRQFFHQLVSDVDKVVGNCDASVGKSVTPVTLADFTIAAVVQVVVVVDSRLGGQRSVWNFLSFVLVFIVSLLFATLVDFQRYFVAEIVSATYLASNFVIVNLFKSFLYRSYTFKRPPRRPGKMPCTFYLILKLWWY